VPRRIDSALTLLAGRTAAGRSFFELAAQALALGLDARWAAIARIREAREPGAGELVETLAFWGDGRIVDPIEYGLEHTPCERVYRLAETPAGECLVTESVVDEFPDDAMLVDIGAESYRGGLFLDAAGNVAGHVFVLDDRPMRADVEESSFFQLVTQRIGSEYIRWTAERALADSKSRLQRAAELAHLGYWVYDEVNARATYISDEMAHICGCDTVEEYLREISTGVGYDRLVHPEDRDEYKRITYRGRQEGATTNADYRIVTRAGEVRHIREVGEPVFDEHGRRVATRGVVQDITAMVSVQDDLLRTKAQFEAIADNSPTLIGLKDLDGRYVYTNKHFARLMNVPDDWLLGKTVFDAFAPDRAQASQQYDQEVLRTRQTIQYEMEVENSGVMMMETKFPIFDPSGAVIGVGLIGTDITERKNSELELEDAKRIAEEATRTKSRFLASMSHELRTPLNAIIGITEMLQEDVADGDQSELEEGLARTSRAGKHLLSLINDILDLSKIEADRLDLVAEDFDLAVLVDDVVLTARELAETNRNTVQVECTRVPENMHADPVRVRQILLNLLSNACKFTRSGTITVRVHAEALADQEQVVLAVTDTGIGIAPEQQAMLFDEFTQIATPGLRVGGTGLGLAITSRLCRLMGGDISVASEVGAGATFTVRLPLRAETVARSVT